MVVIVGGHGKVAQLLTPLLTARGKRVLSVIRQNEQVEVIESLGAEAILADIEGIDARDLAPFLRGAQAVVFAAGAGYGSGPRRKRTVDYGGSLLSQRAALEAGVPRFIQISALVVDRPIDPEADHVWKEYVRAKADADKRLRRTTLGWTIVRPGVLTDQPPTGKIRAEKRLPDLAADNLPISRADVAQVIAECVDMPQLSGKSFDVVNGDMAIAEALAALT